MVKICPNCQTENSEESFWCKNCNQKLIQADNSTKKEPVKENKPQQKPKIEYDLPYIDKTVDKSYKFSVLKVPFTVIFICIFIIAIFYFITSLNTGQLDWENYGGNPWENADLMWENNDLPWAQDLKIDNVVNSLTSSKSFDDIGEFNEDYWFEGPNIKTKDGWTFSYNEVKSCEYEAIVLNYYVYNKDGLYYYPSEIFSPLDIFFGFNDVKDNIENYDYQIINNYYRMVQWQCRSSNSAYFTLHTTNTHLIAHNQEVLNNMKNVDVGDIIHLKGSYVNLYGSNPNESKTYRWTTDDEIGNFNCEIILLDSFEIVS